MSEGPSEPQPVDVCIAGGGPAGLVLGYLLGRCGISTVVLEGQADFDRDFRGDTLHAGVMEIFESIGLADKMSDLPHHKIKKLSAGEIDIVDFSRLETDFPFVTMMAQSTFLTWLAKEAEAFPTFRIEMEASVRELIRSDRTSEVIGVRYRRDGEMCNVHASLVVACDGRGSRLRKEAGLTPETVTDPLEVLWFRLPRYETDGAAISSGALTGGRLPFVLLERIDHYQIAAVIPAGSYASVREDGLDAFHQCIGEASPLLLDRARRDLHSWSEIAFLHVQGSHLKTWHLPGLLLIGDAAHVMTPIGGVGINYAIWDAVEAANVIVPVLKSGGKLSRSHLAEIQARRERPTRWMQSVQRIAGRRVVGLAANGVERPVMLPKALRWLPRFPIVRSLIPRLIALGGKRTRCQILRYFEDKS